VAAGIEAAGSTEGASGILGIGLASGSLGLGNLQQPQATPDSTQASSESVTAKLQELKMLLDTGLITQADFDAAKAKHLGI
jgi:membrane protease subunit (stomatin/prohibitin family)